MIIDENNESHRIIYDPGLELYKPFVIKNSKDLYSDDIMFKFTKGILYYIKNDHNSLKNRFTVFKERRIH